MQQDTSRNTVLFVVIAAVILLAYQFLVIEPAARNRAAELKSQTAAAGQTQAQAPTAATAPAAQPLTRAAAKAASPRIAVDTPALSGSIESDEPPPPPARRARSSMPQPARRNLGSTRPALSASSRRQ